MPINHSIARSRADSDAERRCAHFGRGRALAFELITCSREREDIPLPLIGPPETLLHGTIDLVFREGDEWFVVDYKTDATANRLDALTEYYAPQVRLYANFWSRLVHAPNRGGSVSSWTGVWRGRWVEPRSPTGCAIPGASRSTRPSHALQSLGTHADIPRFRNGQREPFAGSELARAIRTTFERRGVAIPETPLALTPALADVEGKRDQWSAFLRKNGLAHLDFGDVIRDVSEFLLPVVRRLALGLAFDSSWPPGGPWG